VADNFNGNLMALTPEQEIIELAKLIFRQSRLISAISLQLADQACLLKSKLDVCEQCKLNTATVEHVTLGSKRCDKCASEAVVAQKTLLSAWVDVPDADKIRRVIDYVSLVKELDVDKSMVH